ncbi:ribonuclease P protein component [Gracilimonas sp.]|uniref:ribonuclease P protein component n=1 Tax=Gracilimonas sp. TaxID=1974203 RepID=UPI002871BA6E|nr:ribonuclease P protein component [Gracilimonas sp.]
MREKELSNPYSKGTTPERRFTLVKSQILRGRRNFEDLFSQSSLIKSHNVNLRYATYPNADKNTLVGFVAPKRIGNAVERNRTKRLLREAYRLNQHIVKDLPISTEIGLHYVFMAKRAHLTFQIVQREIILLLEQLREQVLSKNSPS